MTALCHAAIKALIRIQLQKMVLVVQNSGLETTLVQYEGYFKSRSFIMTRGF